MNSQKPLGLHPFFTSSSPQTPGTNGYIARSQTPQGRALAFVSFPEDARQRDHLDAIAQTPDKNGNVLCWRRRRRCSNPDCRDSNTLAPHQFSAAEHDLWNCPACNRDRHCRKVVALPNRGCHHHGGKTPHGYALPQTKTGEYSKYIKVDSLRAEFERMLQSEKLHDFEEHIAWIRVRLNEIVAEYGGGASRALLKQMKENRTAYKAELRKDNPDPALMRQLDRNLDKLIAEGAKAYQVMNDWGRSVDRFCRLMDSRGRHVEAEGMMITSDKAWMMLGHVEETFRIAAAMNVNKVNQAYVRRQCEILGVDFDSLSPTRVRELIKRYHAEGQAEERRMLSYASDRFGELAGSGVRPPTRSQG